MYLNQTKANKAGANQKKPITERVKYPFHLPDNSHHSFKRAIDETTKSRRNVSKYRMLAARNTKVSMAAVNDRLRKFSEKIHQRSHFVQHHVKPQPKNFRKTLCKPL